MDSDDEDDTGSDEEEEKNNPNALVCNKFVHERCYIKACSIVDGDYYNDDPPDDFQDVYYCPDCDGPYQRRWKDLGGMETYLRNSGWSFSDSDNDTYNDNTTMENNADSDDDDGGGKQRAVETVEALIY
jgi:hypothetical protein